MQCIDKCRCPSIYPSLSYDMKKQVTVSGRKKVQNQHNQRIIQASKRPLRSLSPLVSPTLPSLPINHVPMCHIYSLLNTSRNGDSTIPMGSLFQCLPTLSMRRFLISSLKPLWHTLRPHISSCSVADFLGEQSQPGYSLLSSGCRE